MYDKFGPCDKEPTYDFMKNHFLHWLEALSLMRTMSSIVAAIRKLGSLLAVSIHSPVLVSSLHLS